MKKAREWVAATIAMVSWIWFYLGTLGAPLVAGLYAANHYIATKAVLSTVGIFLGGWIGVGFIWGLIFTIGIIVAYFVSPE